MSLVTFLEGLPARGVHYSVSHLNTTEKFLVTLKSKSQILYITLTNCDSLWFAEYKRQDMLQWKNDLQCTEKDLIDILKSRKNNCHQLEQVGDELKLVITFNNCKLTLNFKPYTGETLGSYIKELVFCLTDDITDLQDELDKCDVNKIPPSNSVIGNNVMLTGKQNTVGAVKRHKGMSLVNPQSRKVKRACGINFTMSESDDSQEI